MTLGELIVRGLQSREINVVFGNPGIHNLPFYGHFRAGGFEVVTARHEQSAAFMADGYARVAGRPAVLCVIDGPGFLNASTGIGQAKGDSIPIVVLSPGGENIECGNLHELTGQGTISKQICRDYLRVNDKTCKAEIQGFFQRNLDLPTRRGPIHVEIPQLQVRLFDEIADSSKQHQETAPTPLGNCAEATRLLRDCSTPIVIVGGGCIGATSQLREFAESIDAPVVNTVNAKGALPSNHPLRVGYSPSLPAIQNAVAESDLTIAIGTELSVTDFDFFLLNEPLKFQKLIRIDIDPCQVSINAKADCELIGDCRDWLVELTQEKAVRSGARRTAQIRVSASQSPHVDDRMEQFLSTIQQSTDVLVGDSTQPTYYATWLYEPNDVRQYFHSATGFGTLGFAIPASIGAKLANRSQRVTCLIGDGGSSFTAPEIQTATQLGLAIPFVIWNSSGYAEIEKAVDAETSESWFESPHPPRFDLLAEAYGADYSNPRDLQSLAGVLSTAHANDKPTIVEVVQEDFVDVAQLVNWFR